MIEDLASLVGLLINISPLFMAKLALFARQLSRRSDLCSSLGHYRSTCRYRSTLLGLPDTIKQVLDSTVPESETVVLHGWVKSVRRQKKTTFVDLSDGSTLGNMQAVIEPELASDLTFGCSARIEGHLVQRPPNSGMKELHATNVEVLGPCIADAYPIQKNGAGLEFLRKHPHLRLRTEQMVRMLRTRNVLHFASDVFLRDHGFLRVETPIITFSDCEGAGEVFNIDHDGSHVADSLDRLPRKPFFQVPAYATVSSQLYLEAVSSAISRVYTLGPAFRAEQSSTSRHLAEFWMLEVELGFIDELGQLLDLTESLIKSLMIAYHSESQSAPMVSNTMPWKRITYTEAVLILQQSAASRVHDWQAPSWGDGLSSAHELYLTEQFADGPVFVTHYPRDIKPFYMRREEGQDTVSNFDLLVPRIGELAGGSLREERHDVLESQMKDLGLNLENYDWYLQLRQFGTTKHGGFGIGWERLISYVTGMQNLRECIAFPRTADASGCC